jgi:hypothetical protein
VTVLLWTHNGWTNAWTNVLIYACLIDHFALSGASNDVQLCHHSRMTMRKQAREMFLDYMAYHRNKLNRAVHAVFFVLVASWTAAAVWTLSPLWLLLIPPSFVIPHQGHRRIEGNVPATPEMMRIRGFSLGRYIFAHVIEIGILTMFVAEAVGLISLDASVSAAEQREKVLR